MTLAQKLQQTIRDIPDFPKPGILFKDITPILQHPALCAEVVEEMHQYWKGAGVEGVVGIESRGFLFGMLLAQSLGVPFVPVRKSGKLPYTTYKHAYDLEYGSAEVEMHTDALKPGQRVMIHDDLLATGGTAAAAAALVQKAGGQVAGFSFLVNLTFLEGADVLAPLGVPVQSLVSF